jgi:23S rRNA pseudouridine1911/1915/1917 synthase
VRLDERLRGLFVGASRRTIKHWVEGGRVSVNRDIVRRGDVEVAPEDRVELGAPRAVFPAALRLVFEDDDVLVVDKPAGLLTIATERERERTAYRLLAEYVGGHGRAASPGRPRLFVVHRLDRETSGLLAFAKSVTVKRRLQDQFEARGVERGYVAVVEGAPRESEGTLKSHLGEDRSLRVRRARAPREPAGGPTRPRGGRGGAAAAREAITRYRVLRRGAWASLVELSLVTGRRGQIRAQLAELGYPIVGDLTYGAHHDPARRVCLHATRLGFVHPRGHALAFESPAPSIFAKLVASGLHARPRGGTGQ